MLGLTFASAALAITPIEQVVKLLGDMHAQGTTELQAEKIEASRYSQECKNVIEKQNTMIAEFNSDVEDAEGDIAEGSAAIAQYEENLAALAGEIERNKADNKAALEVREKEKADYVALAADYSSALSALERAITHLKKVDVGTVGPADAEPVQVFAQLRSASRLLAEQNPQAVSAAYESTTGGVVQMLVDLQDKFTAESRAAASTEQDRQNSWNQLSATQKKEVEMWKRDTEEKGQKLGEAKSKKEAGMGARDLANSQKKDATTVRNEKKGECKVNEKLLAEQSAVRAQELEAIQQAMDILQGDNVSGAEKRNLKPLAPSFLQISNPTNLKKALALVDTRASALNSKVLSALALRIQARGSPFTEVLKMVRDLVSKLKAEAVAEAEKKGKCDAKMINLKGDQDIFSRNVADLQARVESMAAEKQGNQEKAKVLAEKLQYLSQDKAAAKKTRTANKAANAQTVKESKEAQEAIAQAVATLENFYNGAGAQHSEANAGKEGLNTEVYGGQATKANGVLAILETVAQDFGHLEVETTQLESSEAAAYTELMNSGEVEVAKMTTVHKMTVEKIAELTTELDTARKQLAGEKDSLATVNENIANAKLECSVAVTFEQRMAMREAEIQSLKEVLEVLQGVKQ